MIELIYTSVTPQTLDTAIVSEILTTAKHNNRLNNITGHLFYDGHRFLQIIEGADEAIYRLYNLIESDPRHENVELLYEQEIEKRAFPDWQMAYEPLKIGRLEHPMQDILKIFESQGKDQSDKVYNFGAGLFKIFRDSTITP
jgi:hypothetical protein